MNVAPCSGAPVAISEPPCARASPSAIDRPSPVPPIRRTRAGSARQKLHEDVRQLLLAQADAVVGDRHHRLAVPADELHEDRPALAADRVGEQVGQDAIHPQRVAGDQQRRRAGHLDRRAGLGGQRGQGCDHPVDQCWRRSTSS